MTTQDRQDDYTPQDAEMDRLMEAFADAESHRSDAQRGAFEAALREKLADRGKGVGAAKVVPAVKTLAKKRIPLYRKPLAIAAALAFAAAIYALATLGVDTDGPGTLAYSAGQVESTSSGGTFILTLAEGDGCVYTLDNNRITLYIRGGSTLEVRDDARVHLAQGELLADVVPNSGSFLVSTPDATVSVLGTVFGVLRESAPETRVYVDRGKVRLENSVGSIDVDKGMRAACRANEIPGILPRETGRLIPEWAWILQEKAEGFSPASAYPSVEHD